MIVDLMLLAGNLAGYGAQYRKIYLERRENCFSTLCCLIILVVHVLRLVCCVFSAWDIPTIVNSSVMVAVQLALVELLIRVKREQRMLPSTLFHRLSFRWKQFRRYFWQWDDFMSYVYVTITFGVLLTKLSALMSVLPYFNNYLQFLKLSALLINAGFAIPQYMLNRTEGVEGLSWILIGAWLFVDVLTLLTANLESLFPLFCAIFQLFVLMAILYQKFAYKRMFKSHEY